MKYLLYGLLLNSHYCFISPTVESESSSNSRLLRKSNLILYKFINSKYFFRYIRDNL